MAKLTSAPLVLSNAEIFGASTTQEMDLGALAYGPGGDAYRYVKVGAVALVAGKLYDGPAEIANHQNVTAAVAAVGASTITVTLGATAATANQYAGGYIVVNDVDGQGYTYGIKSNPAANASATLTVTLNDGETVQEALTISSQCSLHGNQYGAVIIHAATETGVPVGVAIDDIAASSYGWIKTGGICSVLQDASAAAVGKSVGASTTTDGSVTANDGTLKEVGVMLETGVSTEYNGVFLTLD